MKNSRHSQRGLSMVEVLVAMAVMVVAGSVALLLYDASRKSFKRGENLTEQQQTVRIAFDMLTSDLRLTGLNYNPDGDKIRPDEQIEAAYDTAIVIRADLDAEDPVQSGTPETALSGGQFLSVSTGNDEIVLYALAKQDGSSSDTLTFEADVKDSPRDGVVETVNVPNLALVHDDPPYTLYRITLNNDLSTWGSSDFITRTPLVENVRSLSFRYYDQVGGQLNDTFDLADTADDIGGAEAVAAKNKRDSIRRIGIDLVGLTRDPDLGWEDTADTNPNTRSLRKFQLTGDVTPRNIGMVGIRDLQADITPPGKPGLPTLVPGHCEGLFITWPPNPPEDQAASYRINYGTVSGIYTDRRTIAGTSYYLSGLSDATTYFVAIQAIDAAGNIGLLSDEASDATSNLNTPEMAGNLAASDGLLGEVRLAWDAVTENTTALPAGDPAAPMLRDLAGYRVYRDTDPSFSSPTLIADESAVGAKFSPGYSDTAVVNCRPYHYQVSAVDHCGTEGAASSVVPGRSASMTLPRSPGSVQAFLSGPAQHTITWDRVTRDINDAPIFIDTYNVYRSTLLSDTVIPTDASGFTLLASVTGATQYRDVAPTPDGFSYWYAASAVDDCPNESARSAPVKPSCAFSGDVVFTRPDDFSSVAGVVPVRVEALNGTDTYTKLTLTFFHETNQVVEHSAEIVDPGPVWGYRWLADPPGPYTVTATVENSVGCAKSTSIQVTAGSSMACCLSPPVPDVKPIILACTGAGPPKDECREISYSMINNGCAAPVAIETMKVTWIDFVGNGARLSGVRFDGLPIWIEIPSAGSPAAHIFAPPKPVVGVNRTSVSPVHVTYVFDDVTSARVGPGFRRDTLTTTYGFRLLNDLGEPTGITGVCGPGTGMFDSMIVEPHN